MRRLFCLSPEQHHTGPRVDPIIITIIDSGVDTKHPDLQGRLWRNPGEIPDNGIDDDLNGGQHPQHFTTLISHSLLWTTGLIDDVYGYNFLADSSDVSDDYFHGTHLSGIVGAVCDNDVGVCGINGDGVVIQACKFLDSAGTGLISNAVKCIDYALKSGAVLTLNSYGGYNQDSPTLRNAINAAERAGQLFVTAAGALQWINRHTPHTSECIQSENLHGMFACTLSRG